MLDPVFHHPPITATKEESHRSPSGEEIHRYLLFTRRVCSDQTRRTQHANVTVHPISRVEGCPPRREARETFITRCRHDQPSVPTSSACWLCWEQRFAMMVVAWFLLAEVHPRPRVGHAPALPSTTDRFLSSFVGTWNFVKERVSSFRHIGIPNYLVLYKEKMPVADGSGPGSWSKRALVVSSDLIISKLLSYYNICVCRVTSVRDRDDFEKDLFRHVSVSTGGGSLVAFPASVVNVVLAVQRCFLARYREEKQNDRFSRYIMTFPDINQEPSCSREDPRL